MKYYNLKVHSAEVKYAGTQVVNLHLVVENPLNEVVTKALRVCTAYKVDIFRVEYEDTCKYLGYDPFITLEEIMIKLQSIKLFTTVQVVKTRPEWVVVLNLGDPFTSSFNLDEGKYTYERTFFDVIDNVNDPLRPLDLWALCEDFNKRSYETWKVSGIGHIYAYGEYKVDSTGEHLLKKVSKEYIETETRLLNK